MKKSIKFNILIARTLSIGFVVAQAVMPAFAEQLVEGGDPSLLVKYQEVLKSVLKMEFITQDVRTKELGASLCTSTLISKNIILTAKHCTDGMADGYPISVAGSFYFIQKSLSPTFQTINEKNGSSLTDIAILLLKAADASDDPLAKLKPIRLGQAAEAHTYSNDFIMAGYGMTQLSNDDGTSDLHVGQSSFVKSNYSNPGKISKVKKDGKKWIEDIKEISHDSLVAVAQRTENGYMIGKQGEIFSLENHFGSMKQKTDTMGMPTVLSGDSGGPALASTAQGEMVVVGVASSMIVGYKPEIKLSLKFDQQSVKPKFRKIAGSKEEFITGLLNDVVGMITDQKLVNESMAIQKDFELVVGMERNMASQYASLFSDKNREFINQSMGMLQSVQLTQK
jgi:hypothetical protein